MCRKTKKNSGTPNAALSRVRPGKTLESFDAIIFFWGALRQVCTCRRAFRSNFLASLREQKSNRCNP